MYLVASEMEARDSYELAIAVAFGFGGDIGGFTDWLGFGVLPKSEDEEE